MSTRGSNHIQTEGCAASSSRRAAAVLTEQLRYSFESFVETAEYLDLYLLMEILQVLNGMGGDDNLVDAIASVLDITLSSCGSNAPVEAAAAAN
jgi:hypothetical protein